MASPARTALIVAAAASLTLLAGFAIKNECTFHDWADNYQYRHYCYSDILPLYYIRGLDTDDRPYLDEFSEYPVMTGFVTYLAARLTDTMQGYMLVTFFFLLLSGFLATVLIHQLRLPVANQLAWAASPALVIHAYTNWDLVAVALAVGGWLAWRNDQRFASALLFGLGGATKLYPAFFLPFLFFDALKRRNATHAAHTFVGGTLGFGVPNFLVFLVAPHNWLEIWRFHLRRDPDFETPWQALLGDYGRTMPLEAYRELVANLGGAAMVLALLGLAYAQWRRRLDPLAAGALLTLIFLLTNRVYSPQYTLWALPFLAILARPGLTLVAYYAADLAVFWVRYKLFLPPPGQTEGWNLEWDPWHKLAVNLRWLLLAILTVLVARAALRNGPRRSALDRGTRISAAKQPDAG